MGGGTLYRDKGRGDASLAEGGGVQECLAEESVFIAQDRVATTTQGTVCRSLLGGEVTPESLYQTEVSTCSPSGHVRPILEERQE